MDNFLTSGWSRKAYIRSKSQESALCMAFSNDDRSIVTGSFDGMLSGYDCASSSLKFNFDTSLIDTKNHSPTRYPITVLQFRPVNIGEEVLLIGCSNGVLLHWNPRQQHLLRKTVESGNDIYTASYSPDGNLHATGGRDGTVRVYDEHSGTLLTSFAKALVAESIVNANRIYSVKWADSHVLLSGGWDNSISVWDIRTASSKTTVRSHQPSTDRVVRSPVRTIFGPYLCGDGLDIHGHTILTASHRLENPIELWDLSTGNKIKDYAWPPVRAGGVQGSSLQEHQSTNTMAMGASFSPNGSLIGVGGSGGLGLTNVALLLNKDSGESILECPTEKGVNSVLFGHKEAFFAFADGAGRLHMYERRES